MRDKEDIEQIVSQLPHFHHPDHEYFRAPDFLDWYKGLAIEDRLTDEEIDHLSPGFCDGHDDTQKILLSLVSKNNYCQGVCGEVQTQFDEKWMAEVRKGGDIFYDIRVRGITPDSYHSVKLTYWGLDVCDGVWNPQTQEVGFPDFTQNNPLFMPWHNAFVKITPNEQNPMVQPQHVTLVNKEVLLNINERNVVMKAEYSPVSRVPSEQKCLVANYWTPKLFDHDELIIVYPDGHEERWQQDDDIDDEFDEFDDEFDDNDDIEPMTVQI